MAFKSIPVPVLTTDTEIVVCPATQEGAAVLMISNVTGSASTYTVKQYKQSTAATLTIAATVAIAAYTTVKFPVPISLEAGDKIIMTAPSNAIIVAGGTFTYSGATPAAVGFTPIGAWSSVATYAVNDVVSLNGNSYAAIQASTNQSPATQTAYWLLLASKGDTGAGDLTASNNLSDLANVATARTNLGVPSTSYVDSAIAGLQKRRSVRAATTANIAIATALNDTDTLDGLTLATGDLVLVKDQSAPAENGIYVVGVTPARSSEFDTYDEHPGTVVVVQEGTANADTMWLCTSNAGGTLDTTAIAFSRIRIDIAIPVTVAQGGTAATAAGFTAADNIGAVAKAGGQTLTGGFKATPYSAGTKSSGTYTPLYSDGNFQTATNGGAHTLAPPADDCSMVIQYTNNASAGAITTSGFSKVTGTVGTVNGDDFLAYIVKLNGFSHLNWQALQ